MYSVRDVVMLAVSLFVVAVILPPALTAIATATLTSVNAAVVTMLTVLLPIIAVIAIVLGFLKTR